MVVQINPSNPFIQVLAEMVAQIKVLTAAVTQFVAMKANSNPNATRGNGGGDRKSRQLHKNKLWNMGGYCSSHGFHPVGAGHNSKTCRCQKEEHNTEAMWNNQLGGNMFWPTATRVAIEQQDHPTWKGKLAPTNGQGGIASRVKSNVELFKREQSLAFNYYACLREKHREDFNDLGLQLLLPAEESDSWHQ
jgi:hypothetical protein